MVITILLLILVVLLFGSSAVLGAFGWVLGFVVAVVALAYASIALDLPPGEVLMYGIGGFIVLIGVFFAVAYIIDSLNPELQKAKRDAERSLAKYPPEERRRIEQEAKRNYEKLLAETKERLRREENG